MIERDRIDVPVHGGQLCVYTCGRGEPLLLLHGWALDHRIFDKQLAALADDYQLIAVDRRGFGESSAPPGLQQEVEDLLSVMDAFDLKTTHLLGMSQGGRIALRFAARHPERLRSLIVQSAALDRFNPGEREGETIPVDDYAVQVGRGELDSVREHWLSHPMMQVACPDDQHNLRRILETCEFKDLQVSTHSSHHWPDDVPAGLRQLTCPALILMGDSDTASRLATARELERLIPDAQLQQIRGGGHLVNLTHAEDYNRAVRAFLALAAESGQDAALFTE